MLLDYLLSEYGGSQPHFWIWEYPMPQAFCLFAAGQARKGIEPAGPTYAQREILAAIRANAPRTRQKRR